MFCVRDLGTQAKQNQKCRLLFLPLLSLIFIIEISFASTLDVNQRNFKNIELHKLGLYKDLSDLRYHSLNQKNQIKNLDGYTAGDEYLYMITNQTIYGPTIFGNYAKQQQSGGQNGYNYGTGGFGILMDSPLECFFISPLRLGGGLSYAQTELKTDIIHDQLTAGMFQMLAYASWTYRWIYIDGTAYYGLNNYRTKRHINTVVPNLLATGKFAGLQYGGKLTAGISVPIYTIELTPMGLIQYTHLTVRHFTETGAPGFNLTSSGRETSGAEAGIGLKLMEVSEPDSFLPEIHVWYLSIFKNPRLIQNSFMNLNVNGPAFNTPGPPLPTRGILVGGSITARLTNGSFLNFGYDLEMRKKLYSCNNGYVQLRYIFMGGYSCCDDRDPYALCK